MNSLAGHPENTRITGDALSLDTYFAANMAQLLEGAPPRHVAIALSGGADSMAACLLTKHWADASGCRITALTVDHALRPESANETAQATEWMQQQGIPHHILRWQGEKPSRGVQQAAREARYRLMARWCRAHDATHLITGHQLDDQLETFWLRLLRGSGPFGLAGMSARTERDGVTLLRPLLNIPRSALEHWLREQGQHWLNDPSNASEAYTRNRLRRMLQEEGLSPHRQLQTLRAMQQARQAEEARLAAAIDQHVTLRPEGYAILDRAALTALSRETALRLLSRMLETIGGMSTNPRMAEVETLYDALHTAKDTPHTRTLGGCIISPHRKDSLLFYREPAAISPALAADAAGRYDWDRRFTLTLGEAARSRQILALHSAWDQWQAQQKHSPHPLPAALPKAVLPTLPAIRVNDRGDGQLDARLIVPHIMPEALQQMQVTFAPQHPLQRPEFCTLEPLKIVG